MDEGNTVSFELEEVICKDIYDTLKEVSLALEERGYNSTNQIVGYLLSGDLGYISSYKESRNKISKLDRNKIIELMYKEYMK